jgi:hypothetical protein
MILWDSVLTRETNPTRYDTRLWATVRTRTLLFVRAGLLLPLPSACPSNRVTETALSCVFHAEVAGGLESISRAAEVPCELSA